MISEQIAHVCASKLVIDTMQPVLLGGSLRFNVPSYASLVHNSDSLLESYKLAFMDRIEISIESTPHGQHARTPGIAGGV